MLDGFNSNSLFGSATGAGFTTFLLSLLKPFIEKIPGLSPDSSLHDATIRVLNVAVNALTVVALNYQAGTFNWGNWLTYLTVAVAQAIGSQGLYSAIASTSGAAQAVKASPAPVPQPVIKW
jgi:hypothetical protein